MSFEVCVFIHVTYNTKLSVTNETVCYYFWAWFIRSGHSFQSQEVKVKVKFTLEQAMKAQRGSRSIAVLFL
jgi:hypothetical protein